MPQEKLFWKKYEFTIIVIITLLFIYFLVFFNQQINFLLGNELIVSLTPQQKSLNLHYGEKGKAEFDVSIDNVAYCRAECAYSFNDRSTNDLIDKGNFEIEKGQLFTKTYELGVKRLGSGQDIYSFDVACHSVNSFFCLTKSPEKSRSSLAVVNYDLTETEKALKKALKQNVTELLGLLSDVDISHQRLNQKYFELGFKVDLQNLSKQKIGIDDEYDKTRISIENLRSLWSVENYIKLSQLFNQSYSDTLDEINNSIQNLDKSIDDIVELHNELLSGLGKISVNLKQLESFSDEIEDSEISNNMNAIVKNFNKLSSSIINNTFENYDGLITELAEIVELRTLTTAKSKIPATELFFKSEYFLKYENDLLCSLKQDCIENISINDVIKNNERFIESYPSLISAKRSCNSLKDLDQTFLRIRNETSRIIIGNNVSFPSDSNFLTLTDDFKDNAARQINNSYYDSFEKIKSGNKINPDIIKIAESVLPTNKTNLKQLGYNRSINLSLYLLSKINLSDEITELLNKCARLEYQTETGSFNFNPISTNVTYNVTSKIETNLSDNPPICCVFNDCKPCCRDESCKNDPKTFPIIFLHGHSFAKDNSPEFSLDSFNKLQSKLQDDGYVNAGIVSLYSQNEQLQQGIWGLSGKPVTVKVSYYYDAFRKEDKYIVVPTKSENIDTYALRLKDLIDIVKQRTNKPKVNIIAHSMGGLVAKRYVQIFGENDIDKLIMIATPVKGISSEVSSYCGYVGENRECRDMQENSLFINKLNDPLKQSTKVKLYTIIGQGCQMKSGDGDGVVLSENAKLDNSKLYRVNGTCGGFFGNSLHTEILNINRYPATYNLVKEILKE